MNTTTASSLRRRLSLSAFTKLFKAYNAINSFQQQQVPLPAELQGSGFPILEALLHKGPLSQRDLAGKILRTSGNISQAVDKLEKSGLVRRSPGSDRRTYSIELTPAGRQLIETYFPKVADSIERLFTPLSVGELQTLSELLKKVGISIT